MGLSYQEPMGPLGQVARGWPRVSAVTVGAVRVEYTLRNPQKAPELPPSAARATPPQLVSYVSVGRRKTTTRDKQLPRALSGVPHGDVGACTATSGGGRLPARLKERVLPRHGGTKGNENKSRTAVSFGCFSEGSGRGSVPEITPT